MLSLNKRLDLSAISPKRVRKYPFASMQPGDNFTVPYEAAKHAVVAARGWARRNDPAAKFISRRNRPEGTAIIIRVE